MCENYFSYSNNKREKNNSILYYLSLCICESSDNAEIMLMWCNKSVQKGLLLLCVDEGDVAVDSPCWCADNECWRATGVSHSRGKQRCKNGTQELK
jgi:hypothetical protein